MLPEYQVSERALIAAFTDNPDMVLPALRGLDPDDIANQVARAVVRVADDPQARDMVSIATLAAEEIGETPQRVMAYLLECNDEPHNTHEAVAYVGLIQEAARKRKLLKLLNGVMTDVMGGKIKSAPAIARLVEMAKGIMPPSEARTLAELVEEHYQEVIEYHDDPLPEGEVRGYSTGMVYLDRVIGGLEASFTIVGARPSVGKTSLGSIVTQNVAPQLPENQVALYVTTEMSETQLLSRMACSKAKVDRREMRAGRLDREALGRYMDTLAYIGKLPLEIMYARRIEAIMGRLYQEPKPGFVVVDYLNDLDGGMGENRNQVYGYYAKSLFDAAKELGIPIWLMAQLSRKVEQRNDITIPVMSDLRDSGELEQKADIILMLHRETNSEKEDWNPRLLTVVKRKDRIGGGQHEGAKLYFGVYAEIGDFQPKESEAYR